jgi:hypothetical protein
LSVGIAEGIAGSYTEERHVQLKLSRFDQMDAATVRVDIDGMFQQTIGNGFGEVTAHAGGINPSDDAGLYVVDERSMAFRQRTGRQGQIFEPHAGQHVHHIVDDLVSLTECMVERNRLSIAQARVSNRCLKGVHQLAREFFGSLQVRRMSCKILETL